jgi:PAS domain S-box-containing protein
VSEVVTNAVLHAHTEIDLTVAVERDGTVRVEVRDGSLNLPLPRDYTETASTGRGLGLVEVLASSYGVHPHAHGKTVWFVVGDEQPDLSDWDLDEVSAPPSGPASGVEVWLRGLPVSLYQVLQQQNDALLREYALVEFDAADGLPPPDLAAADRAHGLLALAVSESAEHSPGADRVDVRLDIPAEIVADFAELRTCLSRAVNLARAGLLLTRPALPEIRALRTWCLEQVMQATSGAETFPWVSVAVAENGLPLDLDAFDVSALHQSGEAMVATDDRNRILALNAKAAELLRWSESELVGHRVLAIIPSRLRDAHVAAFSWHLLTGRWHVLGAPLRVPVLRGDSTEVLLDLALSEAPAPPGRSLYLARFTEPAVEAPPLR